MFHHTTVSFIDKVGTFDLRLRHGRQAVRTSLLLEGGVLASFSMSLMFSSAEAVALSRGCSEVSDIDNQDDG